MQQNWEEWSKRVVTCSETLSRYIDASLKLYHVWLAAVFHSTLSRLHGAGKLRLGRGGRARRPKTRKLIRR